MSTERVLGARFEISGALGAGCLEKVYEHDVRISVPQRRTRLVYAKDSARGQAGKISVAHGAHIFSRRPAGANCLKSPRLNVYIRSTAHLAAQRSSRTS